MRNCKSKIDIFNKETFKYVQRFITNKDLRILEVGCGKGDFGFELMKTGIELTALDTDKNAVEFALKKGVPAKHLDFLLFNDDPFDVIIFSRSLHHIHNLKEAITHSKLLLKKEGKLIIEDFDFEMVNENTTRWYYDTCSIISAIVDKNESPDYINNSMKEWKNYHHHEHTIHSGKEMIKTVKDNFRNVNIERNAYLYRSICSKLENDEIGCRITKQMLEIENGLIMNGSILSNGLRIVAKN